MEYLLLSACNIYSEAHCILHLHVINVLVKASASILRSARKLAFRPSWQDNCGARNTRSGRNIHMYGWTTSILTLGHMEVVGPASSGGQDCIEID